MSKTKSENDAKSSRRFDHEQQEFARHKFSKRHRADQEAETLAGEMSDEQGDRLGDDDDTEIAERIDLSRLRRMSDGQ